MFSIERRGGYNKKEVEAFIQKKQFECERIAQDLKLQNADLKKEVNDLEKLLRAYKGKDAEIRQALVEAYDKKREGEEQNYKFLDVEITKMSKTNQLMWDLIHFVREKYGLDDDVENRAEMIKQEVEGLIEYTINNDVKGGYAYGYTGDDKVHHKQLLSKLTGLLYSASASTGGRLARADYYEAAIVSGQRLSREIKDTAAKAAAVEKKDKTKITSDVKTSEIKTEVKAVGQISESKTEAKAAEGKTVGGQASEAKTSVVNTSVSAAEPKINKAIITTTTTEVITTATAVESITAERAETTVKSIAAKQSETSVTSIAAEQTYNEETERISKIKPISDTDYKPGDLNKYATLLDKYLDEGETDEFAASVYARKITPQKRGGILNLPNDFPTKSKGSSFDLKEAVNPKESLEEIMSAFDFAENEDDNE